MVYSHHFFSPLPFCLIQIQENSRENTLLYKNFLMLCRYLRINIFLLVQSTLALWTPCYYGHSLLWTLAITDKFQISSKRGLTGNDSRYYSLSLLRSLNNVPRVSPVIRVDFIILNFFCFV